MKTTKKNANGANNSNTMANVNDVNLPVVNVEDATTTKGKQSANFDIVDAATAEAEILKIDKNNLFSVEISDYFCPVKFDASALENALNPLVASGVLSADAKTAAIDKAKKEFFEANKEIIDAANNLSFAEVVEKLNQNKPLFEKVLSVCNVSELVESRYIVNGKCAIYRGAQCTDKDGNNRYTDVTLKTEVNGVSFEVPLFVEYRDITTSNVLLSIRYYQTYLDASKKLLNKVSDYKRILENVSKAAAHAKENGFTLEQVLDAVKNAF